jgi:effector-binding domain-containing protein
MYLLRLLLAAALVAAPLGLGLAQTPPAAPPPAAPAAPSPAAPAAPAAQADRPTLLPERGDPMDVDEVELAPKPAAVLTGSSTWDDGLANLRQAFATIEQELDKAGLKPRGRPLATFVETDDMGFRYEAMIPIEALPDGRVALSREVRFGRTPEGRAFRFVHRGPYEEIDQTYETITAYLDAKGILVRDAFTEEYATDPTNPQDPDLEVNIFVLPR